MTSASVTWMSGKVLGFSTDLAMKKGKRRRVSRQRAAAEGTITGIVPPLSPHVALSRMGSSLFSAGIWEITIPVGL